MNSDPTRLLTPPQKSDERTDPDYFNPVTVFDYLSWSKWAFELVYQLTGEDIPGKIVKPLVGHWDRVSVYGDALTKMSGCLRGISTDLMKATTTLDTRWDGNASDAAHMYFGNVSKSLQQHAQALTAAGEKYEELATAMWQHKKAVEHVLKDIIEVVAEIAILAAVGTATAPTGVGPAVSYSLAMYKVYQLYKLIHHAKMVLGVAASLVQAFISGLYGFSRTIQEIGPIAMAGNPYVHPSARCQ